MPALDSDGTVYKPATHLPAGFMHRSANTLTALADEVNIIDHPGNAAMFCWESPGSWYNLFTQC